MLNPTKSFVLGIIAAVLALILEVVVSLAFPEEIAAQTYFQKFTWLLLATVLIEESLKLIFLLKISSFVEKNKLIVQGLFLGAGFGITELLLKKLFQENLSLLSLLPAFFIHLITCLIASFILSKQAKFSKLKSFSILALISLIHLIYNLLIIYFF